MLIKFYLYQKKLPLSFSNIAQEVMDYHEFTNENSFYESLPVKNFSIA